MFIKGSFCQVIYNSVLEQTPKKLGTKSTCKNTQVPMWGRAGEKKNPSNHQQLRGCSLNLALVRRRAWPIWSSWDAMERRALGVQRTFPTEIRAESWKMKHIYKRSLRGPPGTSTREAGAVSQPDNTARSPISSCNPSCLNSSHLTRPSSE